MLGIVAGDGEERGSLERLTREVKVADRVRFMGRTSDDEVLRLLATCRAVVFPPYQEDYGFVTVEAFASRKAVVTCADSGGPTELVADGESGFIRPPSPNALATALRRLADDPSLAQEMGARGFATGAALTWPDTVRQLVLE